MRAAPAVSVVLGAAGLLVGATLFFSDGSRDERVFPLGTAALLLTAVVASAVLVGALPRPVLGRAGAAFLALLAAFVVWSGISVQWSIAADASWAYFNRDLVYLAFAVLGVVVSAFVSRQAIAGVVAALLGLVVGWALLGKVVPRLFPDGARRARLRDPIDYWNALALLCAVAVLLGLWLASSRSFRPVVRAAGVVLVYAAAVAAVLTYSRAGMVVLLLGALAWVALAKVAFDSLAALTLAVPAALGVAAFGVSVHGVADDSQLYSTRVHDGRLFGVVLVAVGVGVFGAALAAATRPALPPRAARRFVRAMAGAGAVLAVVFVVALVWRGGGPGAWIDSQWNSFRSDDPVFVSNDVSRFETVSSNNRWIWWQEAWRAFRQEPLLGKGAGTFLLVNRIERRQDIGVSEPHNVPLQFLSDTGIVGFLLALGALAAGFAAALGVIRRLDGPERGAALALALGVAAYCLHWLVDFDWDFLAVTAPVFFMLGAVVPSGAAARVRRPVWAVGVAALALVAVTSLLAPWLANRRVDGAYAALGLRDFAAAASDAEDAHRLNPLSVDPLLAWGLVEESWGIARQSRAHLGAAYTRYRQAVDLQPRNPDTWFALGAFELQTLRWPRRALDALGRSFELDPYGSPQLVDLIHEAQRQVAKSRR
jgi:O-antigen ligase